MRDPYAAELIRPDTRAALDGWASGAQPFPGSFITAVLENDLKGAVRTADLGNLEVLPAIVAYVVNVLPSTCHGSPEAVAEWRRAAVARMALGSLKT